MPDPVEGLRGRGLARCEGAMVCRGRLREHARGNRTLHSMLVSLKELARARYATACSLKFRPTCDAPPKSQTTLGPGLTCAAITISTSPSPAGISSNLPSTTRTSAPPVSLSAFLNPSLIPSAGSTHVSFSILPLPSSNSIRLNNPVPLPSSTMRARVGGRRERMRERAGRG